MMKSKGHTASETLAGVLVDAAQRTGESLAGPSVPPDTVARRFLVLAAILAVAGHVLWWMLLTPVHQQGRNRASRPVSLAYWPSLPGASALATGEGEVRGVSSPVLFALPSPLGFSKPMLMKEMSLRPPLEAPGAYALFLPRKSALAGLQPLSDEWLGQRVSQALADLPLEGKADSVFSHVNMAARGQLYIWMSPEFGQSRNLQIPLEAMTRPPSRKPWEAAAYVELDDLGRVTHAFLETPAPSGGWNALLVRGLYQLRFGPELAGQRGRLLVRYSGLKPKTEEKMP